MSYEQIIYEIMDDVAVIKLNRPETLNAVTGVMGQELLDATCRAEREARAMLIGCVGRGFCSGLDLSDGAFDLEDPGRDLGRRLDGIFNPIIYQMRAAGIPVVTAVRGHAVGIGCGIALAGDIIIASETAVFWQAFSRMGLAPDGGSSYLLARAIGRVRAMEMMLLAPKIGAVQALEWGLINRVVADDTFEDEALDLARELAAGPRSLGIIKRAAWAGLDSSFEQVLMSERVAQREAGRTDDFKEGVHAFRGKRKPEFKGR